jgi:hypothetical protein
MTTSVLSLKERESLIAAVYHCSSPVGPSIKRNRLVVDQRPAPLPLTLDTCILCHPMLVTGSLASIGCPYLFSSSLSLALFIALPDLFQTPAKGRRRNATQPTFYGQRSHGSKPTNNGPSTHLQTAKAATESWAEHSR